MSSNRQLEFDPEAVQVALVEVLRSAWQTIKTNSPSERPYGIVLYEGADHGYVCVTPFTEEALDRTVAEYRNGPSSAEYEGDLGRESLRWSTPDCPYHVMTEVGCPPLISSEDLYELWKALDRDEEPFREYRVAVRRACLDALAQVDREGLFGADRGAMTLMIEDRDGRETVEEIREIIGGLNPPDALERYERWRLVIEAHWAAKRAALPAEEQ